MNKDQILLAEAYDKIYQDQIDESVKGAIAASALAILGLFSGQNAQGQATTPQQGQVQQVENSNSALINLFAKATTQANNINAQYKRDWKAALATNDTNKVNELDKKYYADIDALRQSLIKQTQLPDDKFEELLNSLANLDQNKFRGVTLLSYMNSANLKQGAHKWMDSQTKISDRNIKSLIGGMKQTLKGEQPNF
jgi:hypothetical protein